MVVREAIEWISSKRAEIGDAAGHAGRGGRHGVAIVVKATPVPPCVVARVMASIAARRGMLSDRL